MEPIGFENRIYWSWSKKRDRQGVDKMKTKVCTKCKKELPATSKYFAAHRSTKSGLQYRCKECERQYRLENKERLAEYDKKYYEENKTERLEYGRKYSRKYRKENKEKVAEYNKRYYEENKTKRKKPIL